MQLGRRIMIIGPTCAGKTTVSARLAAAMGLGVVEVDVLRESGKAPYPPTDATDRDIIEAIDACSDGCVVSGSFSMMLRPAVLEQVDNVIWLNLPITVTFPRAVKRWPVWPNGRWAHAITWYRVLSRHLVGAGSRRRHAESALAGHRGVIRLRSQRAVEELLRDVERTAAR